MQLMYKMNFISLKLQIYKTKQNIKKPLKIGYKKNHYCYLHF